MQISVIWAHVNGATTGSYFKTFTKAKKEFNNFLTMAKVGDRLAIWINGKIVYSVYAEGYHKPIILIDETKADWV